MANPGRTRRRHHIDKPSVPNDPRELPATPAREEPAAPSHEPTKAPSPTPVPA